MKMEISKIKELAAILKEENIEEFELQENDFYIRLLRAPGNRIEIAQTETTGSSVSTVQDASAKKTALDEPDEGNRFVTSPIVGTFYRAPSPDAEPFVEIGSKVQKGQVMCIIEAMKLMNELEADYSCEVKKILVDNGQSVEYGEPILEVKPL